MSFSEKTKNDIDRLETLIFERFCALEQHKNFIILKGSAPNLSNAEHIPGSYFGGKRDGILLCLLAKIIPFQIDIPKIRKELRVFSEKRKLS